MTREDKRLVRFGIIAVAFSFGLLWLTGELMLWRYPLSEVDKKCMSKTMLELPDCWTSANEKK